MLDLETARNWYSQDDPVHGLDHVSRVLDMAKYLARMEGGDAEIVAAAVLLHDAQSLQPNQQPLAGIAARQNHHLDSAEFAHRVLIQEGWLEPRIQAVQHCIRAHRFRDRSEPPQSLEAKIIFDADKLDAIGAIGVARAIAYSVQHGQPIYWPVSAQFRQTGLLAEGERHSSAHEYIYKLCKIKELLYTVSAQTIAAERHTYMESYFQRLEAEISGEH